MRGIPILEKYRYILYFKRYEIIILLNSVFHTLLLRSAPVGDSASQIAAQPGGKCDNRTTRWIKQIKLSTHPKLINENSRSEIWLYFANKTDDKSERTKVTAPVCKRCYKSCVATGGNTSNLFKHLSLAHPDLFRELRDRQVSVTFINSDLISTYLQLINAHTDVIQ